RLMTFTSSLCSLNASTSRSTGGFLSGSSPPDGVAQILEKTISTGAFCARITAGDDQRDDAAPTAPPANAVAIPAAAALPTKRRRVTCAMYLSLRFIRSRGGPEQPSPHVSCMTGDVSNVTFV